MTDTTQGVHTPPDDHEEVYFEGPPSLRGQTGTLILSGLASVAIFGLSLYAAGTWGGRTWWLVLVALVVAFGLFAYPVLATRTRRYKVTNYRIDFERGLISTTIDSLELWHVDDINMHQTPWDKLLNVGTITVKAHDQDLPVLEMNGLPDPRKLFDLLKQRVISVKRSRGVIKLDPG
jgi:membrane protein YdbS with pleckstrin-like domain